jgi:hypothetical protein
VSTTANLWFTIARTTSFRQIRAVKKFRLQFLTWIVSAWSADL